MEHPVPIVTEKSVMNYQRSFVTWLSGRSGEEVSAPALADKWKHVMPPGDDSQRLHRTCSTTLSEVKRNWLQHFVLLLLQEEDRRVRRHSEDHLKPESSGTFCSSGCFMLFTMTLFTGSSGFSGFSSSGT